MISFHIFLFNQDKLVPVYHILRKIYYNLYIISISKKIITESDFFSS